jgi:hypothetical protein
LANGACWEAVTWMGKPERAREWERESQLGKGGLEVFNNFGGDDVWIGKVGAVFERVIFKPKDVEVEFIALTESSAPKRQMFRCDRIPLTPTPKFEVVFLIEQRCAPCLGRHEQQSLLSAVECLVKFERPS